MPSVRKRYVQVGLGGRSAMFTTAIVDTYRDQCELVGFCDTNRGRMELRNREIADKLAAPVPMYAAGQFDQMIAETRPHTVIVTSVDVTHSDYICRAMELGCDVVTEKPMTTDEQRCRRIVETARRTGRDLQVTFNYRYSPPRSQVKEILMSGAIGEVASVDFAWLLDTRHGADYFRRWHRRRANSGSLLVHKATHHFDLVNWWLDDVPARVFAFGRRVFYTPEMGDALGLQGRGARCHDCAVRDRCRFALNMAAKTSMKSMYLDCEGHDGYHRDQCVFSGEIDIWDNMAVSVAYARGAIMSYMLHANSPYEGYQIAFNGTRGRLEHRCCESSYVSGDDTVPGELKPGETSITLIPEFSKPEIIPIHAAKGGHGGGDTPLLADVFDPAAPVDPLRRRAGVRDGAYSILVGVAGYHSIDSGQAVDIAELLGDVAL